MVADPKWRPTDRSAYAYLLGLYLGDGHIVVRGASAGFRLSLDDRYPDVVDEAITAIRRVLPKAAVSEYSRGEARLVILHTCNVNLPFAFPQHGAGRKHERPIELLDWQAELCREHPQALIRGLLHSDGCRTINRFSVDLPSGRVGEYAYARYFFSNLSADIRRIFCDHCELLGIRWSQSNARNISVSDRRSVALLDSFVGPKT
jgi:hypothetical protein